MLGVKVEAQGRCRGIGIQVEGKMDGNEATVLAKRDDDLSFEGTEGLGTNVSF